MLWRLLWFHFLHNSSWLGLIRGQRVFHRFTELIERLIDTLCGTPQRNHAVKFDYNIDLLILICRRTIEITRSMKCLENEVRLNAIKYVSMNHILYTQSIVNDLILAWWYTKTKGKNMKCRYWSGKKELNDRLHMKSSAHTPEKTSAFRHWVL